jgi:glucose/arabinose dehydrogenase
VILKGWLWQGWEGSLAVANLKGQHLRVIKFDDDFKITKEEKAITDQGRLRSAVQGPDGKLYISTDIGKGTDKILVVTPSN